jgi:hypothetical protein
MQAQLPHCAGCGLPIRPGANVVFRVDGRVHHVACLPVTSASSRASAITPAGGVVNIYPDGSRVDGSRVVTDAQQRQLRITKAAHDAGARAEERGIQADHAGQRAARLTAMPIRRGADHRRPAVA